jgi:gamma-polyglutamate synthase
MTVSTPKLDALRERLLAPELRSARAIFASGGLSALVAAAHAALVEVERARAQFEAFSSELESAPPAERARCIERYLRATLRDKKQLARDLRALRKASDGMLDLATLGERALRSNDACERRAEAALGLARAVLVAASASHPHTLDVEQVLALARSDQGRWSRRTEALKLLATWARRGVTPHERAAIARTARALASPTEQRWVQAAALATLASVDLHAAHALALERLTSDVGPDDFIVRARIAQLSARYRRAGWYDLLTHAHADRSELVRMTAARIERSAQTLAAIARSDASAKVRSVALIALRKRTGSAAQEALCAALTGDAHALVVQTAAQEIATLARHGMATSNSACSAALLRAAARSDLPGNTRALCEETLLLCSVLGSEPTRDVYRALAPSVSTMQVGTARRLADERLARVDDGALARVLALLATSDFALGVDQTAQGMVLHRGEQRSFAAWRAWFELLHPAPSKRQGFHHATGKHPRGALRAPPGGMAELAATRVPGERVLLERAGGWGRYLPLVDDLLSTGLVVGKRVALASPQGITTLLPAATLWARLAAWRTLTFGYARFAELRRRALLSEEPEIQASYLRAVADQTGIKVSFAPHELSTNLSLPVPPQLRAPAPLPPSAASRAPAALLSPAWGLPALLDLRDLWQDAVVYAASPGGNRLSHLAAYALTLLVGMTVRGISIRRSVDRDRAAIPLVIGGWGTRGKSGTERLKAALFQGLGHECLVKTTGCEAMFIHALPGVPAREIFIYRPYDKASVWEQREVLALARRLGVRVFLWECMALQPDLVDLLQAQWMRDDASTITNAYPDHEDVQGPTGFDVATVISEFIPTRGKLFTTEEQMLPLLRERARARATSLCAVRAREAELIADDLLARFSYQEHPRNIALVARLARSLGVDTTQAIVEMADNVVPDLGVLKTYPRVSWLGRTLSFTNGMSANERTGALANWQRAGFQGHDPDADPARWIVTVVNNRADRVARSEVFARVIVEDISAHRHVLIGTNVTGLLGFIQVALSDLLRALSLTRDLTGSLEQRLGTVHARLDQAFARLKLGRTDAPSVLREWEALGFPALEAARIEALLSPAAHTESYAASRHAVTAALSGVVDAERLAFAVRAIAARRSVRALHALADASLASEPSALEEAFRATYRALFEESLVPIVDATTSGDAIIEAIALQVPPGAHAAIMGLQNIKGTGLDFVYRWVSLDMVERMLQGLHATAREQRERALTQLLVHDDYGMLDAATALAAVSAARARDPEASTLPYPPVITRLTEIVAKRTALARTKHTRSLVDRGRQLIGETLDFLDAVRRRGLARHVLDALVEQRVSHATAAVRMREIMARSKGAWMRSRS